MRKTFVLTLWLLLSGVAHAETVEVDIHGMSCGFCVEGLRDELVRLPDIDEVKVSLKNKKVRIVSAGDSLNLERVKRAITDAGYTPLEVRRLDSDDP